MPRFYNQSEAANFRSNEQAVKQRADSPKQSDESDDLSGDFQPQSSDSSQPKKRTSRWMEVPPEIAERFPLRSEHASGSSAKSFKNQAQTNPSISRAQTPAQTSTNSPQSLAEDSQKSSGRGTKTSRWMAVSPEIVKRFPGSPEPAATAAPPSTPATKPDAPPPKLQQSKLFSAKPPAIRPSQKPENVASVTAATSPGPTSSPAVGEADRKEPKADKKELKADKNDPKISSSPANNYESKPVATPRQSLSNGDNVIYAQRSTTPSPKEKDKNRLHAQYQDSVMMVNIVQPLVTEEAKVSDESKPTGSPTTKKKKTKEKSRDIRKNDKNKWKMKKMKKTKSPWGDDEDDDNDDDDFHKPVLSRTAATVNKTVSTFDWSRKVMQYAGNFNAPENKRGRRGAWIERNIETTTTHWRQSNKWLKRHTKPLMYRVFPVQMHKIEDQFGSSIAGFFNFCGQLVLTYMVGSCLWLCIVIIPHLLWLKTNPDLKVIDKTGYGWMWFHNYPSGESRWFGYAFCMLASIFIGISLVIKNIFMSIAEQGSLVLFDQYGFTFLGFGTWSFYLTNSRMYADQAIGIAISFKERLSEIENEARQQANHSNSRKLLMRRLGGWTIVGFLLIGACVIQFLNATHKNDIGNWLRNLGFKGAAFQVMQFLTTSGVFITINSGVPIIINKIIDWEQYEKQQTALYIQVIRTFILRMVNNNAVFFGLIERVIRVKDFQGCCDDEIGSGLLTNVIMCTLFFTLLHAVKYILAFVIFGKRKVKKTFLMSTAVLNVLQLEAWIWLGSFLAPVMAVFGVVSLMIVCLGHYFVLVYFCKTGSVNWREPQHNIVYLSLAAITMLLNIAQLIAANTAYSEEPLFISLYISPPANGTIIPPKKKQISKVVFCGPLNNDKLFDPLKTLKDTATGTFAFNFLTLLSCDLTTWTAILLLCLAIYLLVFRLRFEINKMKILQTAIEHERNKKATDAPAGALPSGFGGGGISLGGPRPSRVNMARLS